MNYYTIEARFPLALHRIYYIAEPKECSFYGKFIPMAKSFNMIYGELYLENGIEHVGFDRDTGKISTSGHFNIPDFNIKYEKWLPADKELVWAWDNGMNYKKHVGFYAAENNCLFCQLDGARNGISYDHYAPYEGEWPEWAKEAYERLEA